MEFNRAEISQQDTENGRSLLGESLTGDQPGSVNQLVHESSKDSKTKKDSVLKLSVLFILSFVVIGLVQLLGWVGKGQVDPWVPNLTVLQMTAIIASGIQIIMFIPAFIFQTEKFYDLTGTMTYIVCSAYSFAGGYVQSIQRQGNSVDIRAILATCFVGIWSLRLGSFLFIRVLQSKKDGRFDEIKPSFVKFFITWNIQGLWVFLGCMPTFILNSTQLDFGFVWTDVVGGILFCFGFLGEVIADEQKKAFNAQQQNKGKWINVGLWRKSRHPNYFCEWVLQFGLFVFASAEYTDSQWIAVLSPIFVAFLLAFISGVPLLEQRADEKWGDVEAYQVYKRNTSVCIPLPQLGHGRELADKLCIPSFLV